MSKSHPFVQTTQSLLSSDEETKLFEAWREARDAGNTREENRLFEKITIQYSPIVRTLVSKMRGYKMDPEELLSEALLALVKAAQNYDPTTGLRFSTYANSCIRGSLFTYISKFFFITNVCANSKNKRLFFQLRRVMAEQIKKSGSVELTPQAIDVMAEEFGVSRDAVRVMHDSLREPYQSLQATMGENADGMTREDLLVSESRPQDETISEIQVVSLRSALIQEALNNLDERSRVIFQEQVLREEDDVVTLEVLGKQFGISKERTRQLREIAKTAITKHLNRRMEELHLTPSDLMN